MIHISCIVQGLYSLSGKTSYRKISWSLEAARFGLKLFQSLCNLAGTSAALLPRCLSNFRAIRPLQHPISRLRDFTGFGGKTSYRLVNRGPEKVTMVMRACIMVVPVMNSIFYAIINYYVYPDTWCAWNFDQLKGIIPDWHVHQIIEKKNKITLFDLADYINHNT